MRLVKTELIQGIDPFGEYYDYLLANRSAPSCALEIVRIGRELSANQSKKPIEKDIQQVKQSTRKSRQVKQSTRKQRRSQSTIPDWQAVFLSRKGKPDA